MAINPPLWSSNLKKHDRVEGGLQSGNNLEESYHNSYPCWNSVGETPDIILAHILLCNDYRQRRRIDDNNQRQRHESNWSHGRILECRRRALNEGRSMFNSTMIGIFLVSILLEPPWVDMGWLFWNFHSVFIADIPIHTGEPFSSNKAVIECHFEFILLLES